MLREIHFALKSARYSGNEFLTTESVAWNPIPKWQPTERQKKARANHLCEGISFGVHWEFLSLKFELGPRNGGLFWFKFEVNFEVNFQPLWSSHKELTSSNDHWRTTGRVLRDDAFRVWSSDECLQTNAFWLPGSIKCIRQRIRALYRSDRATVQINKTLGIFR